MKRGRPLLVSLAAVCSAAACAAAPVPTPDATPTSAPPVAARATPSASPETGRPAIDMMAEQRFWDLVERSAQGTGGDADLQAEQLQQVLSDLPTSEVIAFHLRLVDASTALFTYRHEAAGDLLCGSLGVDGFTDFRSWVVSRGRKIYTAALADPDTLATAALEFSCPGAELFAFVASDVYEQRTGRYPGDDGYPIVDEMTTELPTGPGPYSPEQAATMFPALAALGAWTG